MLENFWNKKEKPFAGFAGYGGGAQSLVTIGASGDSFWISEAAQGSWGSESPQDIVADDDGNIYTTSFRNDAGGSGLIGNSIVKYEADGTMSWQKVEYRSTSGALEAKRIVADATGDHIYISGESNTGPYVHKINKSDGTVDWRRIFDGGSNDKADALVMASDGNIISVIKMDSDSSKQAYFNIDESDGSDVWKTMVKRTSVDTTINNTKSHFEVDSSGNLHSIVWADTGGTPRYRSGVVKHNSSGVLQSISDYYTSDADEDLFGDISVDSSGNKYISYRYNTGSGYNKIGLMKVDSSDVIQWQKGVDSASHYLTCNQVEVMPEDAGIIMSIEDRQGQPGPGDNKLSFVRFDTSGNVEWIRQFGISGIDIAASSGKMRLNKNGNIIFDTYFNDTDQYAVVAQLPSDGTLTGNHTVGSRTYEWAANTAISFTTQTAWSKYTSIYSADTNSNTNSAHSNVTLENNVQTFTKGDVD